MSKNLDMWNSSMGMQVHAPTQFVRLSYIRSIPESKWKLKRSFIIDKMKRRKALINRLLNILIFIAYVPVTAFLWVMLLSFVDGHSILLSCFVGICIAETWILGYVYISDLFETDGYYVRVKHRGKYL